MRISRFARYKRLGGSKRTLLVFVIALIVPLLSMVPSCSGYLHQRSPDKIFLGFSYLSDDHYQYASFIEQTADEGRFFMENRFTTEPQKPRFLLLYLWMIGQICKLTGLSIPAAWELMRVFVGFSFMLIVWGFITVLITNFNERMFAYLLVAFSGGIGWALYLVTGKPGPSVTPAYLKDAFNYDWNWSSFGSMLMPMWMAPAAIFLLCAYLCVQEGRNPKIRRLLMFLLPPMIWFMHPYTGIVTYLAFGLFPFISLGAAVWRVSSIDWRRVRDDFVRVLPVLVSFLVVAVYLFWARQDKVFETNGDRIFTWNPTYSVFLYPFAYGLLLPLAIYGLKWSFDLPPTARNLMIAWLTSSVVLSINPFVSGVKFQYLVHLPLTLFAAHGVFELRRRVRVPRSSLTVILLVCATMLFLNGPLIMVKHISATAKDRQIYSSTPEIDAMSFLKSQSPGNVVSGAKAGNLIPWLGAKKVYFGHWFLNINHDVKAAEVAAFFDPKVSVDEKRAWLSEKEIRYVYYGPEERSLGVIDPQLRLNTIYENERVIIGVVP